MVPDGWIIPGWVEWQQSGEQLKARRGAGRKRAAARRARNGVTNGARDARVTPPEVEGEVHAAAAASVTPPSQPIELPGELLILRSALDARKLTVRWDRLSSEQVNEIRDLVHQHGDGPLVTAGLRAYRPDKPAVYAQA